jgi:tryptophan synthase alpha chain
MIDAGAGVDAVEIGLPFSDPMLDGRTIQQASSTAIARGATTPAILAQLRKARTGQVPLIAMSYANHAYCRGLRRYCGELADAGFSGTIIPDLPAGEAGDYLAAASEAGLDATLMVTPATPQSQLEMIAERSRGFLYVMSVMATRGTANARDDDRRWAVAAGRCAAAPGPCSSASASIPRPGRWPRPRTPTASSWPPP